MWLGKIVNNGVLKIGELYFTSDFMKAAQHGNVHWVDGLTIESLVRLFDITIINPTNLIFG